MPSLSPQGLISKITYAKSKSVFEEPGFKAGSGQTLEPEHIILILFLAEEKEIQSHISPNPMLN